MNKTAAIVFALALVGSACGSDGDDDTQAKIDLMMEQGESEESATCYADELSEYSVEDFEALIDLEDPADMDEDFFAAAVAAGEKCGADS